MKMAIAAALDRHWFAPASLRELAVVRILSFGTQTLFFMHWQSLQEHMRQTRDPAALYQPVALLRLLLLPFGHWAEPHPTPELLKAVWTVAIVAGILATIGLFARPAMLFAAYSQTVLITHWYSYGEYHHPEALITVLMILLSVSPSADVWSVDAWIKSHGMRSSQRYLPQASQSIFARWPLRLMQWLIALMYLSATASKLYHGGLHWMNGYTLCYHFLSEGLAWNRKIAMFMASLPPWLDVAPSVFTIVFEASFGIAILLPRTAWLYVFGGTIFHILIWLTQGPAFFPTVVIYSVFAESIRRHFPWPLRRRRFVPDTLNRL